MINHYAALRYSRQQIRLETQKWNKEVHQPTDRRKYVRDLDDFVASATDDVNTVVANVDSVDWVCEWAVQLTNQRPVERLPETDFTVSAGRDDLVFQRMVTDIPEQRVDS